MVAKLHDGHGNVSNPALLAQSLLPLALEWVGNDLVVVGKHASVPDSVSIGDALVSIDGRPIADCYADVSRWISAATDGWRRYVSAHRLIVNLPTKDPAQLVFRKPDGRTATIALARVEDRTSNTATEQRPENGTELAAGVVYMNLNGAETDALTKVMPKLSAAKAIIFDLRGYPGSAARELMLHLIDAPATSARWCIPIVRRPAPAVIVHTQVILRLGMVLFRRLAVQPYGQRHVSRHVPALHIDISQGELGQRIARVSRAAVPLHRLIDVARQAASCLVHGGQNVLGFGVVVIGRLPVMGRRRRHAALARQRHRLAEGLFRHDRVDRHWRRGRIDPCGPARRATSQQSDRQYRR